ncbi:uncharacterized protein LOC105841135 [Monomorium pharaonis]|uniref:uncharacterized protein LOC105841135 n=1 Tax=Monomorium pharaonis TaxID=307658 RepID=UPI00063F48AF|nr:uncharacterized protein LOC105841135 [Monomorium pharaonis]
METQTENPSTTDRLDNTNVPVITANLEMLTIETNPLPTETKRILRKRVPKSVPTEILNRRCSLRPKKRKINDVDTEEKMIKEYYLDKKINKKSNLETIYEENDNLSNDTATCMSVKRFKRMLTFCPSSSELSSKLKKRRAKIQKVFGSKIRYKRCSMQALVDKLNTIRENSPMKLDNERKS